MKRTQDEAPQSEGEDTASAPHDSTKAGKAESEPAASQDPGVDNLLDDVDVRDLLREVFDESDNIKPSTDIMVKVRQTLREESGGRYFNDAWSSSSNPIRQFLLTSLVMLLVAILIAILLVPYGMSTLP